jgi:hypothetical protein
LSISPATNLRTQPSEERANDQSSFNIEREVKHSNSNVASPQKDFRPEKSERYLHFSMLRDLLPYSISLGSNIVIVFGFLAAAIHGTSW